MLEHIAWIFSGIGTTLLSVLYPKKYRNKVSNKVKGDNNKVAGGNIVNNTSPLTLSEDNSNIENYVKGNNNEVAGKDIQR